MGKDTDDRRNRHAGTGQGFHLSDEGRRTKVALFSNAEEGMCIKRRRCYLITESACLLPKFRNKRLDKVDA